MFNNVPNFRISILYFILILISGPGLFAGFTISEVDTTAFPQLSANFILLDKYGDSYNDVASDKLTLTENGISIDNHEVSQVAAPSALTNHIVILMDNSSFMNTELESGKNYWDCLLEGVRNFVTGYTYPNDSKIALLTYNSYPSILTDFSSDKMEMLEALSNVQLGGSNNFNTPFLDKNNGAVELLKEHSPDIKRIIIFITASEPYESLKEDKVSEALIYSNIRTFVVNLAYDGVFEMNQLVTKTHGKAYEASNSSDFSGKMTEIRNSIGTKPIYNITWTSDYPCQGDETLRSIELTYTGENDQIYPEYNVPDDKIASAGLNAEAFGFGYPDAGATSLDTLVVTANIAPLQVNDVSIIPSGYFRISDWGGEEPPFEIPANESRTFTIEFKQDSKMDYQLSNLIFDSYPCSPIIRLAGGHRQVEITSPVPGDLFSICDSVGLSWEGLEDETPVYLYYSMNNGSSWNNIENDVTEQPYYWHPTTNSDVLFRVFNGNTSHYKWSKNEGSGGDDGGTSIAITNDNVYLYVCGYYEEDFTLGGKKHNSSGYRDLFIAKYDTDGNVIWSESAGGSGTDTASGVTVNDNGDAYVTGTCYKTIRFGSQTLNLYSGDVPYCFIAKYPARGGSPVVATIGAVFPYTAFKIWGQNIRYHNGNIYVRGYYIGNIEYKGFTLSEAKYARRFTATYSEDLELINLEEYGASSSDYSSTSTNDIFSNVYETGFFSNILTSDDIKISSRGGTDAYIRKRAYVPGSMDIMEEAITIGRPVADLGRLEGEDLTYPDTLDFGDCAINSYIMGYDKGRICNRGNYLLEVTEIGLVDSSIKNFSFEEPDYPIYIEPGDCYPLLLNFGPNELGPVANSMYVVSECIDTIVFHMKAHAYCTGKPHDMVDFSMLPKNQTKDSVIECALENLNPVTIKVNPIIEGDGRKAFKLDSVGYRYIEPGGCMDLKIIFMPKDEEVYIAQINYQLPDSCENQTTEIIGTGVREDAVAEGIGSMAGIINIEPNPASDLINIKYYNTGYAELEIEVYNSLGNKILSSGRLINSGGKNNYPVDISELTPGMYFIKMESNGKVYFDRFVVNR